MIVMNFVGRPGTGKSTARVPIEQAAKAKGLAVTHIRDRDIFARMMEEDTEGRLFEQLPNGSFDVKDPSVIHIATQEMEKSVKDLEREGRTNLVTTEFARGDYEETFRYLSPHYLQNSFFVFVDADVETCLDRLDSRVRNPQTSDDHPHVQGEIYRKHFGKDNAEFMKQRLSTAFGIRQDRMILLDNPKTKGKEEYMQEVTDIIEQRLSPVFQGEIWQPPFPFKER